MHYIYEQIQVIWLYIFGTDARVTLCEQLLFVLWVGVTVPSTYRPGKIWSDGSTGKREAEMGGDSNTSSAMEYNSSWASACQDQVVEVRKEKKKKKSVQDV